MDIAYGTWLQFPGWQRSEAFVKNYLDTHRPKSVLEIGSGANPTIKPDFLTGHPDLVYTTNDIDPNELAKADASYQTLLQDFSEPNLKLVHGYDLIFSKMVNEHVKSGKDYYGNIFNALNPGGRTFHLFSTLYAFPFLVNRIVPEGISSALLSTFNPRDDYHLAKFKAYYSWSRGPTKSMIRRFQSVGYEVVRYHGFFGHAYYKKRLGLLHRCEVAKANLLVKFPINALTSYALLELRRPGG